MIDLHLHTTYSDGSDSVKELLEKAEQLNLEIISITDHDSVGAYLELEEHPEIRHKFSGEIIIGSEIEEEKEYMMNLCKKYNRFMSDGSDYHAKNKPTTFIGTGINNNINVQKDFVKD